MRVSFETPGTNPEVQGSHHDAAGHPLHWIHCTLGNPSLNSVEIATIMIEIQPKQHLSAHF